MQMLYEGSEESPGVAGLGVLPGRVRRLPDGVKRPQMQWNRLVLDQPTHPMLAGPGPGAVGLLRPLLRPAAGRRRGGHLRLRRAGGGGGGPGPVWATQFHPEKSGAVGLALLANFVAAVGDAAHGPGRPERPVDLYPAIDLRGGRCVRLVQGDFAARRSTATTRSRWPRSFPAAGARWIHVVDLDAARTGDPVNRAVVAADRGRRRRRRCASRRAAGSAASTTPRACSSAAWPGW